MVIHGIINTWAAYIVVQVFYCAWEYHIDISKIYTDIAVKGYGVFYLYKGEFKIAGINID